VGLLSNETSSAASSCMTEWLVQLVPSNTACVAEQGLALKKCYDWAGANKSVLLNLLHLQLWWCWKWVIIDKCGFSLAAKVDRLVCTYAVSSR
jgi:hypothetical protein